MILQNHLKILSKDKKTRFFASILKVLEIVISKVTFMANSFSPENQIYPFLRL